MVRKLIVSIVFVSALCSTSWASGSDVNAKADDIVRNWRTVDLRTLREPANAEAIKNLKKQAMNSSRTDVRVPLLRLGDPNITELCLAQYRKLHFFERGQATKQLAASNNPAIISLVADDLFRNESTDTVFVPPEYRVKPVSVHAGEIIRAIIMSNAVFNQATKNWATSVSK